MTNLKLLWARFNSETPKVLAKLAKTAKIISVTTGTMALSLAVIERTAAIAITLAIIAAVAGGISTGCSLATTDPKLANKTPDEA